MKRRLAALFIFGLIMQGGVQFLVARSSAPGLALDDGYIHLTFARSLLRGEGFAYNPHEPTPGSTSPGWSALIAASAIRTENLLPASILLCALFYALLGCIVYWISAHLGLRAVSSLLAAMMTLLAGRLIWAGASGMEICSFAFFSLAGTFSHILDRRAGRPSIRTAFILGIASLFRPEGYLLYAISVADHAIRYNPLSRTFHFTFRPYRTRSFAVAACVYLLIVMPYMLFCLATNGHLFPNTYYAKLNENFLTDRSIFMLNALGMHLDYPHSIFIGLAPVGILALMIFTYTGWHWRNRLIAWGRILYLWPVALVVHGMLFNPSLLPHFGRYLMPLIPFSIILSATGFEMLIELLEVRLSLRTAHKIAVIFALIFIGAGAMTVPRWVNHATRSIDNINRLHVRTGKWIANNTPPDAVIATHDVGAIAFYGQRKVIDVLGLVSTDITQIVIDLTRHGEGAINAYDILMYVAERKPDYLAGFPSWMDGFARQPDAFKKLFQVRIKNNLISGSDTMAVWQADWTQFDPLKALPDYGGYGYGGYAPTSAPASFPTEQP